MGSRYPFREDNGDVIPKQTGDRGRSVVVTEARRRSGSEIVEKPRLSEVSDQTNDIPQILWHPKIVGYKALFR